MALATFANVLDSNSSISFDISDDESDCDRSFTSVCSLLVIRQRTKGSNNNTVQGLPRRIAGSRRVSNYCEKNGSTPAAVSNASVPLLQSITAIPALADRSFEASPPEIHFLLNIRASHWPTELTMNPCFFLLGRKYGWNATISRLLRPEGRRRPSIRY
jgi:hypothetical protein